MDALPEDLEQAVEASHAALGLIMNGEAGAYAALFSEQDDVSLGNPFGPFVVGRDEVVRTANDAATRYRDGEVIGVDPIASYVAGPLACVVEVERCRAKVGGNAEAATISLRVTSVYRSEADGWRLVHRHADPITTPRSSESVVS